MPDFLIPKTADDKLGISMEPELDSVTREALVRQARFTAIGQLAASIAHDLRNPLGVIQNAVYLLRRRLAKTGDNLDLLSMIEDEVKAADAIITNLMEMARPRQPQPCDVQFAELVADITRRIDTSGRIHWTLEVAPETSCVWCDPLQMRRVLVSLVQNAVEAVSGAGHIAIAVSQAPQASIIEVRDDGPGIAPSVRAHLFEPLVSTKKAGAGLGLTICRQIVEQHGGTIRSADGPAGGTVFRIEVPRKPAAAPEA